MKGSINIPTDFDQLETPYQFFNFLFSEEIMNKIREETFRFSVQVDPNKPLDIKIEDIKQFIDICIVMSYNHLPSVRDYWDPVYGNKLLRETLSINKFGKIRQFLQFANNDNLAPFGHTVKNLWYKLTQKHESGCCLQINPNY